MKNTNRFYGICAVLGIVLGLLLIASTGCTTITFTAPSARPAMDECSGYAIAQRKDSTGKVIGEDTIIVPCG